MALPKLPFSHDWHQPHDSSDTAKGLRLAFNACHVCVQGEAAAADQPVSSLANLEPAVAPQPMFESNLEAGIKAATAEKAKKLKQKGHKAGSLARTHRNPAAGVTRREGQVLHLFFPSCKMLTPHLLLCFLSCP